MAPSPITIASLETVATGGHLAKDETIRSISRGLAVIKAVNRRGPITMMEICRAAELPYPTAFRVVQTLVQEGILERERDRKRYRVTALVQSLSQGYQDVDNLVSLARPHIEALCGDILWPVSIATRVGPNMMVRDSTFAMTTLTFTNYYAGYTLPLMECASGKAYLAFCPEDERTHIIEGFDQLDGPAQAMAKMLLAKQTLLEEIRATGYATQSRNLYNATPGRTSSIAVPILIGEELLGSLVVIFFAAAMTMETAVDRFVARMKTTSAAIATAVAANRARPIRPA